MLISLSICLSEFFDHFDKVSVRVTLRMTLFEVSFLLMIKVKLIFF